MRGEVMRSNVLAAASLGGPRGGARLTVGAAALAVAGACGASSPGLPDARLGDDAAPRVDGAPLVDAATADAAVDAAPPSLAVTITGPIKTTSAQPVFLFDVLDPSGTATTTCAVDGGAPAPCTSPLTLAAIAVGAHTVEVTATDAAARTAVDDHAFERIDVAWDQPVPATPTVAIPGARLAPLAYHPGTNRVVLFGGGSPADAQTWLWDGAAWTQAAPATSPPKRQQHAMALDVVTGALILFGGDDGGVRKNDTWAWDGATWTDLAPATSPSARNAAAMAFDPNAGRMVLFGGSDPAKLDDTWLFDGTTWTAATPTTVPPARQLATLAYDATSARVVMFGGDGAAVLGDTWRWDGSDWTAVAPATSPPARWGASLTAAPTGLLLFGGYNGAGNRSDVWRWDGTTWTEQSGARAPTPRRMMGAAYHPATSSLLIHGGVANVGSPSPIETFAFDGTRWIDHSPAPPARRRGAKLSTAPGGTGAILFGGYDGGALRDDTWRWDGTTWTEVSAATAPSGRGRHAMAYDPVRDRVVLFGGDPIYGSPNIGALADTWLWDGAAWTEVTGGAVGALRRGDGVRRRRGQGDGALRRHRRGRRRRRLRRRHLAVRRHELDQGDASARAGAARQPRDGLRRRQRRGDAVRGARGRRAPRRHLDLGRRRLDRADHASGAGGALPPRDGERDRAAAGDRRRRPHGRLPQRPLGLGRHQLDPAQRRDHDGRPRRGRDGWRRHDRGPLRRARRHHHRLRRHLAARRALAGSSSAGYGPQGYSR
ncbi:MAG: hypothetical protein R2939_02040 [Kofleriaceae bacterium]